MKLKQLYEAKYTSGSNAFDWAMSAIDKMSETGEPDLLDLEPEQVEPLVKELTQRFGKSKRVQHKGKAGYVVGDPDYTVSWRVPRVVGKTFAVDVTISAIGDQGIVIEVY
jgi:hypothetical protein